MDPSRKTAVMQFLVEAKLVQRVEGTGPVIRLGGADLSAANLTGAFGVTKERLEGQASSLEGTIMPDGSEHP